MLKDKAKKFFENPKILGSIEIGIGLIGIVVGELATSMDVEVGVSLIVAGTISMLAGMDKFKVQPTISQTNS